MKTELHPYYPFSRCPRVREEFKEYLKATPNKKHISQEEKYKLVAWLADPNAKPTCQKDYSRRNYAQKTYRWDENRQELWAIAKNDKGKDRIVITEDEILQVVEKVHTTNHGGWDATWDRVNQKYCGIVRSDIIFLVKRCGLCQSDPRKKAKGLQAQEAASASAAGPAPAPSPPMTPPEAQVQFHECPYDEHFYDDNDGENEGNDALQFWQEGFWQQDSVWQQEYIDNIDPSLLTYYDFSLSESSSSNTYGGYDFGQ
ncbi:hypothetical protein CCMA1212_006527 [Trichoderma ghanense]|uniref:Integrase zinc-binding domain-containing protein n=1 Tax=Trichoderma ghanense TaxID=65468 RepID=A0ABY2H2W5_9HYPO